ncbi:hypothetical protein N7471_007200 [Penicillium samsonianum]|uniref:uncharacterized protein n=1 Tax=Penicillium samsonianum TaxID=1882272 RepID=UPI0025467A8F|nr:uncharacterized protein N7471_007200 [Penicillium samsonianum]KAJ6131985.1 hypothetical protein N7471_007200 [Penicillium samsonianum]
MSVQDMMQISLSGMITRSQLVQPQLRYSLMVGLLNDENFREWTNGTPGFGKPQTPQIRPSLERGQKEDICTEIQHIGSRILFTGIQKFLVDTHSPFTNIVMLAKDGQVKCLDKRSSCLSGEIQENTAHIALKNGYVLPGLVAFGNKTSLKSTTATEPDMCSPTASNWQT